MPWRESLSPARMELVALVAPVDLCPAMLTEVARCGTVELDLPYPPATDPDELGRAVDAAVVSGPLAGLVGWVPAHDLPALTRALAPVGAAAVPIAHPRGVQPPTLLSGGVGREVPAARTLVDTYGTVPYADVDPSRLAAAAYVVMFGMMFGDVGQGAILVLLALLLRRGRVARFAKLRRVWHIVAAAGAASMVFGALYGSFFGPTGLLPVLWLDPLESPMPLLLTAVLLGAVLLAGAYTLGTINRVREGGWGYALYARTGVAGSALFASLALLAWGLTSDVGLAVLAGWVLAATALTFVFIGLFMEAGGGTAGAMQAFVEVVDTVIRLGSNVVSFARLAAFGLTHAALMTIVWDGTTALWAPDWRAVGAILLFAVGNVLTFALEALVAGVQALRLEYYELFSRIFQSEGRTFRPWAPALRHASDDAPAEHSLDPSSGTSHEGHLS